MGRSSSISSIRSSSSSRSSKLRGGGCSWDPSTARIAIIGSGLTGLSTALALEQQHQQQQQNNSNSSSATCNLVTIYERDESLVRRRRRRCAADGGYGLTLTYHPTGVLARLGILEDIALQDCPSRSHYLLEAPSGRVRGYFGNDFRLNGNDSINDNDNNTANDKGWGQRGNLRVPRERVREIMVQKLEKTRIVWGYKLIGVHKTLQSNNNSNNNGEVTLQFENGISVTVDVVIAADGIRSAVVQHWIPRAPAPRSLGVRIILGITGDILSPASSAAGASGVLRQHDLLRERGFYSLAKGMRLFVMPYQGSALGRALSPTEPVRYMWQLSFAVPENENDDDSNPNNCKDDSSCHTSERLWAEALQRTQGWHEPVPSLIQSTPCHDVWGTLLHDRDPMVLQQHLLQQNSSDQQQYHAVLIAGDALHAMSPFKGQGANRCLHDGLVLAKWLSSSSSSSSTSSSSKKLRCSKLSAVVNSAMRELVQRTAAVVEASRASAQYWHSPQAITWEENNNDNKNSNESDHHKFAGLDHDPIGVQRLLRELEQRQIGAETEQLDEAILSVIRELGLRESEIRGVKGNQDPDTGNSSTAVSDDKTTYSLTDSMPAATAATDCNNEASFATQALEAASVGSLETLRRLSWGVMQNRRKNSRVFGGGGGGNAPRSIRCLVDPVSGGTCLHAAAIGGHVATVHWLVTQAGCDTEAVDGLGGTARDVAVAQGHTAVEELLCRLAKAANTDTLLQ